MKISFRLKPLFLAIAAAGIALPALAERQSSIQPALVYVTGDGYFNYSGVDATRDAAHYPLILGVSRFFYARSGGNPFDLIHDYNPNTRILNYEVGPHARPDDPEWSTVLLNMIGRWSLNRGHPGLTLWDHHGTCARDDHWFLVDPGYTDHTASDCDDHLYISYVDPSHPETATYWLDFGSEDVQSYWAQATINDMLKKIHPWTSSLDTEGTNDDRPWKTDGLFIDTTSLTKASTVVSKYSTATQWREAMQSFIEYSVETIRDGYPDQDLYFNVGGSGSADGAAAWAYLDGLPNESRPTGLLEEDGFVVAYGTGIDAQFWPANKWQLMVDTLHATSNMNVIAESHTKMTPESGTGVDLDGHNLTYWDAYWFALSSYLLGKNETADNSYFAFFIKSSIAGARDLRYRDENDLDIGRAMAAYTSQSVSSTGGSPSMISIYKREFDKGWVFVNPNPKNSVSFTLPELGKPLDHSTFQDPANVANTDTLSIPAHRGIVVLKDPLIGDWRLDEASGTSAADSHEFLPGDSMDGTAYGSPTWLPGAGVVDGAIQFDGVDDYIAVAHDTTQLETPKQLSISYWAKPDSGTTGSNKATVMQFGTWNTSGWQLWTGTGWNEFAFFAFGGTPTAQTFFKPAQAPLPNQWNHFTVTVENKTGGNVDMYLNGQPFHHSTLATPFVSSASDVLYLGAHLGGLSGATYWGGKLDNVKIQRKVLSPYEVTAEYRSQVADWKLDEPAYRRKAFDNYGAAHGEVHGDPTWLGSGGSGAPLGAIQFDGVDDDIVFAKNTAQLAIQRQFTLNAWVQPAPDADVNTLMQYGTSGDSGWVLRAGKEANEIVVTLYDGYGGEENFVAAASTPIALSTSAWSKLTISVDNKAGGQLKLYVNDVSIPVESIEHGTSTLSAPFTLSPGDTLRMGASDFGLWKGKLGHVQLFGRILNATEISQLTP